MEVRSSLKMCALKVLCALKKLKWRGSCQFVDCVFLGADGASGGVLLL